MQINAIGNHSGKLLALGNTSGRAVRFDQKQSTIVTRLTEQIARHGQSPAECLEVFPGWRLVMPIHLRAAFYAAGII